MKQQGQVTNKSRWNMHYSNTINIHNGGYIHSCTCAYVDLVELHILQLLGTFVSPCEVKCLGLLYVTAQIIIFEYILCQNLFNHSTPPCNENH